MRSTRIERSSDDTVGIDRQSRWQSSRCEGKRVAVNIIEIWRKIQVDQLAVFTGLIRNRSADDWLVVFCVNRNRDCGGVRCAIGVYHLVFESVDTFEIGIGNVSECSVVVPGDRSISRVGQLQVDERVVICVIVVEGDIAKCWCVFCGYKTIIPSRRSRVGYFPVEG